MGTATLFRVYSADELGRDGYPAAWHEVTLDEVMSAR